jgi:putative sterol carrier protein
MSLEFVTEYMQNRIKTNAPLPKVIKFDFGADGVVVIDGVSVPPVVHNSDALADFTVKTNVDLFKKVIEKTQNPMTAFALGKIKVEGDMAVATKLGEILGL